MDCLLDRFTLRHGYAELAVATLWVQHHRLAAVDVPQGGRGRFCQDETRAPVTGLYNAVGGFAVGDVAES